MKAEEPHIFLTVEEAAAVASRSTGLEIGRTNVQQLLEGAILPNFGTAKEPRILPEHAELLTGILGTEIEVMVASLRAVGVPAGCDFNGHELLQLCPQMAISFNPEHHTVTAIQAFVRALRSSKLLPDQGDWRRTMTAIQNGPSVWASERSNGVRWESAWRVAESREAKTSAAESLCTPMLFGSKGRISSFVVSSIRQNLRDGAPVCDLMAGTGLVTRHLLPFYPVLANDAALFASRLAASQAVDIDHPRTMALLGAMRAPFDENYLALKEVFKPALALEDEFLLGGLSSRRLAEYRDFVSACTRFVPEYRPSAGSAVWKSDVDGGLRARVGELVQRGRRSAKEPPFLLTTAYWGNCYFGLRQAAEIDSLRFALERVVPPKERPLIEAIFLSAADACASGPHYAQPPKADGDPQIKQLIEKRATGVFPEFELRLSLACKRAPAGAHGLSVTNMPWAAALREFAARNADIQEKAVYVDPPYTRLQYSRFYHVFDTLLRYDYPACERNGRTSENEKRFSSAFDRRESTVLEEFRNLFGSVRGIGATLFLSCFTGGTVGFERLMALAENQFGCVQVYTAPLQHHSQGVPLHERGHRLEILIVARP
jgi:hypothetical protein